MPRPAACRSVFAAPTALMLALIHLSTASEPYPTQWRVRSSGLVRWDLAEFRLYSDAACRTEIPVLDNIASGRVHGDENPIARQHYFNDKVFDFDVMSYWAGVPDACGNTWVGGIIAGDEPVRCAMLHQSGWLNYATSVALEAWDDGRQAWIGVGGASEMTHCPEGMAMCCFGLQGCPYVDAIAVAADAPTTGPISSLPCASPDAPPPPPSPAPSPPSPPAPPPSPPAYQYAVTAALPTVDGSDLLSTIATLIGVPEESVVLLEAQVDPATNNPTILFTVAAGATEKTEAEVAADILQSLPTEVAAVVVAAPPSAPPSPPPPPPLPVSDDDPLAGIDLGSQGQALTGEEEPGDALSTWLGPLLGVLGFLCCCGLIFAYLCMVWKAWWYKAHPDEDPTSPRYHHGERKELTSSYDAGTSTSNLKGMGRETSGLHVDRASTWNRPPRAESGLQMVPEITPRSASLAPADAPAEQRRAYALNVPQPACSYSDYYRGDGGDGGRVPRADGGIGATPYSENYGADAGDAPAPPPRGCNAPPMPPPRRGSSTAAIPSRPLYRC